MTSTNNITMRQYNGTDYDTPYSATTADQIVDGVVPISQSLLLYGYRAILTNSNPIILCSTVVVLFSTAILIIPL